MPKKPAKTESKITRKPGAVAIDVKRLYLPFVVTSTCPECGEVVKHDLTSDRYLSYPSVGAVTKIGFYHTNDDDDPTDDEFFEHEWSVSVKLDVTLELA